MKRIKNGAVPDLDNILGKESYKPDETGGQDGEVESGPRGLRRKVLNDGRASEEVSQGTLGEEGRLALEHLEGAGGGGPHQDVLHHVHQAVHRGRRQGGRQEQTVVHGGEIAEI